MATRSPSRFPDPVNEVSARLVAAGVVTLCVATLGLDQPWLLVPLAYGFVARVWAGPTYSPLARFVTGVCTPRLPFAARLVPGPPKRFAQGIGATLSLAALGAHFGLGWAGVADVLVAMILAAATLESVFGYCLGCVAFAGLMRAGIIPAEVCERCNNLWAEAPRPA